MRDKCIERRQIVRLRRYALQLLRVQGFFCALFTEMEALEACLNPPRGHK